MVFTPFTASMRLYKTQGVLVQFMAICPDLLYPNFAFMILVQKVSTVEMPNDTLLQKELRPQGTCVVCGPYLENLCIGVSQERRPWKLYRVDTGLFANRESEFNVVDTCFSSPVVVSARQAIKRSTNTSGLRSHLDSNFSSIAAGGRVW